MNIEAMTDRIAMRLAKARPETLFEGAIFDMRKHLKAVKQKLAEEMLSRVKSKLTADIRGITSLDMKIGKFRGSHYISSCKMDVKIGKDGAAKLEKTLQQKYSPKFHIKNWENNVASFSTR